MKKLITYIITLLLLSSVQEVFVLGQTMKLVIKPDSKFTINNYTIQPGDKIITLYDSVNSLLGNGGEGIWDPIAGVEITLKLDSDGSNAIKDGFDNGESVRFKIFSSIRNCFIHKTEATTDNGSSYIDNTIDTLRELTGEVANIRYFSNTYCQGNNDIIIPEISSGIVRDITYSFSGINLILNTTNGNVDIDASTPGSFEINYITTSCLVSPGWGLSIFEKIELLTNDVVFQKPSQCSLSDGKIEVINVKNASLPITYIFSGQNSGSLQEGPENIAGNLASDVYRVSIRDGNLCKTSIELNLKCTNDNNNPDPNQTIVKGTKENLGSGDFILAPSSISNNAVTFDCSDNITILNSYGRVVKKINSSQQIWKGEDNNNNHLPTGLYIIYCNNARLGELTLIR